MSQEGAPKRSGALEAGALAIALLAGADHGTAQALEIDPNTSWSQGIQKLRKAVMEEKKESAASFVKFTDNTVAWPSVIAGGDGEVSASSVPEITFLLQNAKGRKIAQHCEFHTHPHQVLKTPSGKSYEFSYSPPSPTDVLGAGQTKADLEHVYSVYRIPAKNFISALTDTSGIWYYQGARNVQVTPEQKQVWAKSFNDFGMASISPGFNFEAEYKKLQQAYKINLSADIRFVPYDKIDSEPPCAGVDYHKNTAKPLVMPAPKPGGVQNIEINPAAPINVGRPKL